MGELYGQGKLISDIQNGLRTIPLYPETIRAIKFAFSLGWLKKIFNCIDFQFFKIKINHICKLQI